MKKKSVIYGCLIFVMLFAMCSCGARKSTVNKSKEENTQNVTDNSTTEKQSETNVKTATTVKTDDKNETVTEETEYTPQDASKESFVIEKDGTKVVLNNAKKIVRKTTQKNNTITASNTETQESKKETSKEQKAVKEVTASKKENISKQIDKKAFSPFNLLWFLIPIGIIYVFYRIYKKLPLVPKL